MLGKYFRHRLLGLFMGILGIAVFAAACGGGSGHTHLPAYGHIARAYGHGSRRQGGH